MKSGWIDPGDVAATVHKLMGDNRRHLCPCGSGIKQKKCCGGRKRTAVLQAQVVAIPQCDVFSHKFFQSCSSEEMALLAAGEERFNAENFVEAAGIYERVLALNPGLPRSWASLGNAYEKLGRKEEALVIQKRGNELFPGDPLFLYNMGNLELDEAVSLYNFGDSGGSQRAVGAAVHHFQESARLEPKRASCHYNLAIAYSMIRDPIGASNSMRRALNLNPELKLPPGWFTQQ
jgi:Flp pilus assembly protein TadD